MRHPSPARILLPTLAFLVAGALSACPREAAPPAGPAAPSSAPATTTTTTSPAPASATTAPPAPPASVTTLRVRITKTAVSLDDAVVAQGDLAGSGVIPALRDALAAAKARAAGEVALEIQSDPDVSGAIHMRVIDTCAQAGINKIALHKTGAAP